MRFQTHVRFALFRTLEFLGARRVNADRTEGSPSEDVECREASHADGSNCICVYASTIGELNAIEPVLRVLRAKHPNDHLLLLTDRQHYKPSFLARYPTAEVRVIKQAGGEAGELLGSRPLRLLLLAEIPCVLSDAPCFFPFALAYRARRLGAMVCLINGWLYRGTPSCRINQVERYLLGRDYLALFDLITVQDEATRSELIAAGAPTDRVHVTGNVKFDAVAGTDSRSGRRGALLESLYLSGRPIIVAGCVTNISEQQLALDAFLEVIRRLPSALLVLAPRHPELDDRMNELRAMLGARRLNSAFRSVIGEAALSEAVNCLVLDTIGELRDFYAAASIAYVGLNHNILEPMAFDKPVVVTPGWEQKYPSYPVYKRLLQAHGILEVKHAELGEAWARLLIDHDGYAGCQAQGRETLRSLTGATARNIALMERFGLV